MAKRSASSLSSLSLDDLNREISRRRRGLPALMKRREAVAAKLARLDRAIADLGGSPGGTGRARRSPGARGNNNATLTDALRSLLTGKTMGVTEASQAVQEAGYSTNSPNFRTIVNAALMSKKGGFKRVSRGQYTYDA